MKALTLWQPWASLIAVGAKRIETRSWSTKYRGPLAIHAAARKPDIESGEDGPCGEIGWWRDDRDYTTLAQWTPPARGDAPNWVLYVAPEFIGHVMPLGKVVATCDLVDVVPTENVYTDRTTFLGTSPGGGWLRHPEGPVLLTQPEIACGDYSARRFAWMLDNVVMLDEPIPAKGARQLWDWDDAPLFNRNGGQ